MGGCTGRKAGRTSTGSSTSERNSKWPTGHEAKRPRPSSTAQGAFLLVTIYISNWAEEEKKRRRAVMQETAPGLGHCPLQGCPGRLQVDNVSFRRRGGPPEISVASGAQDAQREVDGRDCELGTVPIACAACCVADVHLVRNLRTVGPVQLFLGDRAGLFCKLPSAPHGLREPNFPREGRLPLPSGSDLPGASRESQRSIVMPFAYRTWIQCLLRTSCLAACNFFRIIVLFIAAFCVGYRSGPRLVIGLVDENESSAKAQMQNFVENWRWSSTPVACVDR